MKNKIKPRFFLTRTFVLLIIMLLLFSCLGVMLLLRTRELYMEQDDAQTDSVVSLAANIVGERINTRIQMLSSITRIHSGATIREPRRVLAELKERLMYYAKTKNDMNYKHLSVADADGEVTTPEGGSYNIGAYDFFQQALRGSATTSSVISDPSGDHRHCGGFIAICVPVHMGAEVIGTLSTVMDLRYAALFLKDINIRYNGAVLFLVDRENTVISNSGVFRDLNMYVSAPTNVFKFMGGILSEQERGELAMQMASAGDSSVYDYASKSTGRFISYVTLPHTNNWKLIAVSSSNSIRNSQQKLLMTLGITFVVLALLLMTIILVVYFYAWRSSRLQHISNAMLNTTGLHLLTLHPSGLAEDFDGRFAELLGLPQQTRHFNFDEMNTEGRKMFPHAPFKGGESLRLCCTAPDGRNIYLLIQIAEAASSGIGEAVALDVTADENLQRRERELAYVNQLTHLPNVESFSIMLKDKIAAAGADYGAACFFIGLDEKDRISEVFGRIVLQKVLIKTATLVAEAARKFGGEAYSLDYGDFVLYYEDDDPCPLRSIVEELRNALRAPFKIENHVIEIASSIGVITYQEYIKNNTPTVDEVFRNGIIAMNLARENEGIFVLDRDTYDSVLHNIELEHALLHAVKNGELALHYQPIYDVIADKICAVEALARWNSPAFGPVPPDVFIPIAEKNGFINTLGDWVLDSCIEFARTLSKMDVCIEFNVSAIQLLQIDFAEKFASRVKNSGLPPHALGLEITESSIAFGREASTREKLEAVRGAGMSIYIDDFGTGYSSFTYLKDMEAEWLKIDKSFIHGIDGSKEKREIFRAISAVAQTMGMKTIAEGVESREELETVLELGCLYIQGYLIARPMNAEALLRFLADFSGIESLKDA
ncbi:bifunctional diguanylate cyclase/phosphodiesterase [Cloacibacillus sp.]